MGLVGIEVTARGSMIALNVECTFTLCARSLLYPPTKAFKSHIGYSGKEERTPMYRSGGGEGVS